MPKDLFYGPPQTRAYTSPNGLFPERVDVRHTPVRNFLSWSEVGGEGDVTINGYRVLFARAADAPRADWMALHSVSSPDATTHTHEFPQISQSEYYYRVASITSDGNSRYSEVIGGPIPSIAEIPTADLLDVNGSHQFDTVDTLVMYIAFAFPELVGNGTSGGFVGLRRAMLSGLPLQPQSGEPPSDDDYRRLLAAANVVPRGRDATRVDVNADGRISDEDALILYYASELSEELGDGRTGGTEEFRRTFLGSLAVSRDPSDAELRMLLQRANALLSN